MFAVIKSGGKQYRVSAGDRFTVEKLPAEAGATVEFNEVLMLGGDAPKIGAPLVEGAVVMAEVVEQTRGPKVLSFKKRRRKHGSKRIRGHRQHLTMVEITEILALRTAGYVGRADYLAAVSPTSSPDVESRRRAADREFLAARQEWDQLKDQLSGAPAPVVDLTGDAPTVVFPA